tara:strand:+ start:595 stop:2127 length:1533 start_codon:yes stop_codon:yes gene_type:complete
MNIAEFLLAAATTRPNANALALGEKVVASYEQHAVRSSRIANALLKEFSLHPNDRVAIAMENNPCYSEIVFAAWHAGMSVVPMNSRLHKNEFTYILRDSGAKICFTSNNLYEEISKAAAEVPECRTIITAASVEYESLAQGQSAPLAVKEEEELAWLFYTSGTTGRPKGAMISHGNIRALNTAYLKSVDKISPEDAIVHAAPYSHGSGLYMPVHVERGACQVVPESGGFNPEEVFKLIKKWKGSTFFMAPTMLNRIVNSPCLQNADTSNLKTIIYGGAPMYVEDCLRALERIGPKLVQIYGQGEAPMTITSLSRTMHTDSKNSRYLERLASVGKAQAGIEVRIAEENDSDVGEGKIGEILVRGNVVMQGYWKNSDATFKTLRGGWLHTGDMGTLDKDGYLTLKDRSKDVIISGGSNIYPREVEEILLRHPHIEECSVIGLPHQDWGEKVVAFVVCSRTEKIAASELDELCLQHIARFKRPREYYFLDSLPKNNYGKVLKRELRELSFEKC